MTPPRNAPCPCNRGKKYKHCCGGPRVERPDEIDRLRRAAFVLEDDLQDTMGRFPERRFGPHWYAGITEYLGLERHPTEEDLRSFWFSWAFYLLPIEGRTTPREAAKTAGSRARLEALLKEMEFHESRLPKAERYDVDDLRRALGMTLLSSETRGR